MNNLKKNIEREIEDSYNIKKKLKKEIYVIEKISQILISSIKKGGIIYLIGNGGSASDAQHIAAELVGIFSHKIKRRALPAVALTTNTSILTAVSNDISFDKVFSRQVEALVRKRDVLIGISTSGRSKNVIEAMKLAKQKNVTTIAFTGQKISQLSRISDMVLKIPSTNTQRIQECHILVGHILCGIIENQLKK